MHSIPWPIYLNSDRPLSHMIEYVRKVQNEYFRVGKEILQND